MKNLVKQAKSNQWKSIVYGIYTFIAAFYILLRLLNLPYNTLESADMIVLYWMMVVMIALMSIMFGMSVHYLISGKIWSKVKSFKRELKKSRHIHHLRMIEKYIDLGDKEKSKILYNQYLESSYMKDDCASFFDGAIHAKFSDKLDFIILDENKKV